MRLHVFTLLFLIFVLISCDNSNSNNNLKTVSSFIVQSNQIKGWIYDDSGWVANNFDELMEHIDGSAAVYERYTKTISAAYRTYSGIIDSSKCKIRLYIYDMNSPTAAKNVYADEDIGLKNGTDWQGGPGNAARYIRNSGLSQLLSFYYNNYFILLDIPVDTDSSLSILKQFALSVYEKMK